MKIATIPRHIFIFLYELLIKVTDQKKYLVLALIISSFYYMVVLN